MGFFTDFFNGGRSSDILSESLQFELHNLKLAAQECQSKKYNFKSGADIEFEMMLDEAKRKWDSRFLINNRERLKKLRNPKSIYLRKKKAT